MADLNITILGMARLIEMYLEKSLQYVNVSRAEVMQALAETQALVKVLETPPPAQPAAVPQKKN